VRRPHKVSIFTDMIRVLLVLFNAAAVTYLVYHLLTVIRKPMEKLRKTIIIVSGVILLLAPFGMFMRLYPPSVLYLVLYPVAISFFLYLTYVIGE
jgi:hypothetical protein